MVAVAVGLDQPASPQAPPGPLGRLERTPSPVARVLLIALNLAAVACCLLSVTRHGVSFGRYRIDLDVYRLGSQVWLHRGDLYGVLPLTSSGVRLPFSYPPVAAAALSPLSLMPMALAGTLLTLASVALTGAVLRMFLRYGAGVESWWTVGWLLPAALSIEPVRNTLNYGQVNVLLMALVAADCLLPGTRWPRGALVGLAAAVKLTPAAFVLFFLCRGDRRAAGTAAASFAAWTAIGFALDSRDSVRYWTSIVASTSRPGNPLFCANQSIQGVLARAGLDPHTPAGTAAWLAASAAVLALAWRGMRRASAASDHAWALSLNAFAALLISPISWSHHWVWAAPALLLLAVRGLRDKNRSLMAAALAGLAVFAAGPQWWFPHAGNREAHWAAWEQVIGGSYMILAAVILVIAARRQPVARQR